MATALEGRDGWLFLQDDGYRSVEYYTGQSMLSQASLEGWKRYFETMRELRASKVEHLFIVAPNKENLFPDFYPLERCAEMPIDVIRNSLRPDDLVYPVKILGDRTLPLPTYPKTDTHWSDFGAMLVAKAIVERLGARPKEVDPSLFFAATAVRDLGIRMEPPVEERLFHYEDLVQKKVYDNRLAHTGKIMIFEHPAAELGSCVLFGDSFAVFLCKWLKWTFRRLVFVFSTAIDWPLVRRERPDYLFAQKGERGIINAFRVDETFSLKTMIAERIFVPGNPMMDEQVHAYEAYFGEPPPRTGE